MKRTQKEATNTTKVRISTTFTMLTATGTLQLPSLFTPLPTGRPLSTLKVLVTLSRHGSRRPNPISTTLCPNNVQNSESYHVPPEQLTEIGMEQMRLAGEEVRREYIDNQGFLSNSIGGPENKHFETYFRSDAADRCAQSAVALGYGLYPDSTAPDQYYHQPISVYMNQLPNEHDFAAPKGPCKAVAKADIHAYLEPRALETIQEHKALLEQVGQLCGINVWDIPTLPDGEDLVTGIKDIADTFTFDAQQGLRRLKGLTAEQQTEIEGLAFQHLMERYFSTDREVTYWVGGFPTLLLKNLQLPTPDKKEAFKYYSYHGHRELLHGMGQLLGWTFDFAGQPRALNTSALDPATTLFFELHQTNSSTELLFVRTFVWSPRVRRTGVKLAKCSAVDCPLAEFTSIIQRHIEATGPWEQICNYHAATFAPVLHPTTSPVAPVTTTTAKPVEATMPAETKPETTTTASPTTTATPAIITTTPKAVEATKPVETKVVTTTTTTTSPTTTATPAPVTTAAKSVEGTKPAEAKPVTITASPTTTATPALVTTTAKPVEVKALESTTATPKVGTTAKPVVMPANPVETTAPKPAEVAKTTDQPSISKPGTSTTMEQLESVQPNQPTKKVQSEPTTVPTILAIDVAITPQPLLRLNQKMNLPPLTLFEGIGWVSYLAVAAVLVYFAAKRYKRRNQTGYHRLD
ncbi:hypothetical protein DYB34_011741 [Aphanomyces astaci]|uniref:Histidine acid phosphatase n=1 Tax=Aphanomyces astaci TaxID=112090 RepID=A0A3R6W9A1_APHAT|nr:hypothetical protein DYB34_011741 [Aphanomyces astaci]